MSLPDKTLPFSYYNADDCAWWDIGAPGKNSIRHTGPFYARKRNMLQIRDAILIGAEQQGTTVYVSVYYNGEFYRLV